MRYHVLCGLFAVGCTLTGAAAQTNAVHEPFRVVASSGTVLRVDIGARPERATSLRRATVLTPSGAVRANLVRTERVCEWLCGTGNEDGKECHFEAILRAAAPVDKAVGVLAGSPDVREISTLPAGSDRAVDSPARWIEAEPISDSDRTFRWTRFPDGVFLTSQDMGRDFYAPPIDLANCAIRPVAPFTIVSCPTTELLYEGSRGIAISVADYGEDTVEPLLRFRLNGRDAVVIRLGLKAAVATALLVRSDDGLWRLNFRRFDYAQLC
jgi:hypothetical protein